MAGRTTKRTGVAPTLSDVAKAAGVSPMTVSRVVNRDPGVKATTRARVNDAISALNYAPNTAARALVGATRIRIAVIHGNPSAAYLSEVLLGALEEASRTDVQLVLEKCDIAAAADTAHRLAKLSPDGVILPPPFGDAADLLHLLKAARTPTAVIGSASPPKSVFAVGIDDAAAAREMTAHLIALGHTRIGFIIGNPNQTASATRFKGYQDALKAAGIPYDPELAAQGDFTYRSGLRAAHRLLRAKPRPTAIFASNDDMAAAAVAAAHTSHLEAPEDLSVCGFDDTALATTTSPELTTIRQPVAEMAQAAVAMLTRARRRAATADASPPEHAIFPHLLIRRKSVGPPPL